MARHVTRKALFVGAIAVAVWAAPVSAVPILLPLNARDFNALGVTGPATALMTSPYNYNNTFTGEVFSQAFSLADGRYLYLYQAKNLGPSVLEVLAVSPFLDLVDQGYLTANEPPGFLDTTTGVVPFGPNGPALTYDSGVPTPTVSFNYPSVLGAHVPPGSHTVGLYLISDQVPTVGEAYVIDSGTAIVDAVVPVPEPAAAGLLLLGAAVALLRHRRRQARLKGTRPPM